MMSSIRQLKTYQDYQSYQRVWMPQETGDQSLFIVRVPSELEEMSWSLYQELISLRFQWMMREWLKEGEENQGQTHQRLARALYRLNAAQVAPNLFELDAPKEWMHLSGWTWQWGEAMIEINETWRTLFDLENEEIRLGAALLERRY